MWRRVRWNAVTTHSAATAGTILGAIAGARRWRKTNIAAAGHRTAGSILGGVVGAGIGGSVGNAHDRYLCDTHGPYYSYNDTITYREAPDFRSGRYDYALLQPHALAAWRRPRTTGTAATCATSASAPTPTAHIGSPGNRAIRALEAGIARLPGDPIAADRHRGARRRRSTRRGRPGRSGPKQTAVHAVAVGSSRWRPASRSPGNRAIRALESWEAASQEAAFRFPPLPRAARGRGSRKRETRRRPSPLSSPSSLRSGGGA